MLTIVHEKNCLSSPRGIFQIKYLNQVLENYQHAFPVHILFVNWGVQPSTAITDNTQCNWRWDWWVYRSWLYPNFWPSLSNRLTILSLRKSNHSSSTVAGLWWSMRLSFLYRSFYGLLGFFFKAKSSSSESLEELSSCLNWTRAIVVADLIFD